MARFYPAYVHITSVSGANGEVRYHIATVRDITGQRQMLDELRIWSDVFNHATFGIVIADPTSNIIIKANNALASMHGMRIGEIEGRSLLDLYAPTQRNRYANLRAIADQTGFADLVADRIRKDGSIFPARIHASSLREESGAIRYLVGIVQDISIERQLQSEVDQSRRLEAIGQLSAGIAHDFNNVLQGIMANLELVDDDIGVSRDDSRICRSAVRLDRAGRRIDPVACCIFAQAAIVAL